MNLQSGAGLRLGWFLATALAAATSSLAAQDAAKIDEAAARANLVRQVDPIYPPIATAAGVSGDVVLQVKISASGTSEKIALVSGNSLLQQAALNAVKQWKFKPAVVDGMAESVTATLTIPFRLADGPDTRELVVAKLYFALEDKCHALVGARADTALQAAACKAAAAKAEEFDTETRFIERRSAYVFCATALLRNKQFAEAVEYGDKAVGVVKQGHDDGSGSSAAYAVKGQAEAFNGQLVEADDDLAMAEKFQRAAMDTDAGRAEHLSYAQSLKGLLTFRAQVLEAAGKTAEAGRVKAEADSL